MPDSAASTPEPCDALWQALSTYSIGPEGAALSFAARLARENGWSAEFTQRVIEEYKRFVYLAVTAGHEVTPSDAVDQVWHLHLTYTRDYWERFCPEVLGARLHHGPTAGGSQEQHRFFEQYAQTLRSYTRVFGKPPFDIWPDARRRFFHDPFGRRVNPRDLFLIPRPLAYAVLGGLTLGVALLFIYLR